MVMVFDGDVGLPPRGLTERLDVLLVVNGYIYMAWI